MTCDNLNHRIEKLKTKKRNKLKKKRPHVPIINNRSSSAKNVESTDTKLDMKDVLKIKMKQKRNIKKQKKMTIKQKI